MKLKPRVTFAALPVMMACLSTLAQAGLPQFPDSQDFLQRVREIEESIQRDRLIWLENPADCPEYSALLQTLSPDEIQDLARPDGWNRRVSLGERVRLQCSQEIAGQILVAGALRPDFPYRNRLDFAQQIGRLAQPQEVRASLLRQLFKGKDPQFRYEALWIAINHRLEASQPDIEDLQDDQSWVWASLGCTTRRIVLCQQVPFALKSFPGLRLDTTLCPCVCQEEIEEKQSGPHQAETPSRLATQMPALRPQPRPFGKTLRTDQGWLDSAPLPSTH